MALDTMTNRSAGDTITAADWDAVRDNVIKITGTPSGDEGWNDVFSVYNPSAGTTITDTDTNDIINAVQDLCVYTGATNNISDVSNAGTIQDTDLNNVQSSLTNAYNARTNAASSYLSQEAKSSSSRTSAWSTTVTHEATLKFESEPGVPAVNMREGFFNAGGSIYFTASRSGGATNDQNTDWTNMLSAMGTVKMNFTQTTASSGTTTSIGNYDLTTGYSTIFTKSGSGSYSTNYYKVEAKAASSTEINFRITFGDSHTGRGYFDSVDGTLSSVIGMFRPNSGTLPNGYTVEISNEFINWTTNSNL